MNDCVEQGAFPRRRFFVSAQRPGHPGIVSRSAESRTRSTHRKRHAKASTQLLRGFPIGDPVVPSTPRPSQQPAPTCKHLPPLQHLSCVPVGESGTVRHYPRPETHSPAIPEFFCRAEVQKPCNLKQTSNIQLHCLLYASRASSSCRTSRQGVSNPRQCRALPATNRSFTFGPTSCRPLLFGFRCPARPTIETAFNRLRPGKPTPRVTCPDLSGARVLSVCSISRHGHCTDHTLRRGYTQQSRA